MNETTANNLSDEELARYVLSSLGASHLERLLATRLQRAVDDVAYWQDRKACETCGE